MRTFLLRDVRRATLLVLLVVSLTAKAQTGQQPTTQVSPATPATGEALDAKAARKAQVKQLALEGKYGEAYALGKQILAEEPEDLRTLLSVSWSAMYMVTGGTPLNNAEATTYAQRALQLIHEGKTPEENKPFSTEAKDQILGWLEYALGIFVLKTAPEEAIGYLTIAAQSEGFQKYDPQTYALLALAYDGAQYARQAEEYRKRFTNARQRDTPEGQAAMAKIIPIIDRMIDAYARAVALSGDNPSYAQKKVEWMKLLAGFYRFRRGNSDAGLDELVAGVLNRPLGTAMNERTVAAAKPVEASPAATAAPQAPQPSPTPARLDPMLFSTWAYYLTTSTSNGNNASSISGTLKLSQEGAAFDQDLHVPLAQTSFAYKYTGTFRVEGNRLSLVYRDAQGVTKTDTYDFILSPELKALRLTRSYGSATTSWILLLKGTENVSRCTEQGKTLLSEAVCRPLRKAG